MTDPWLVDTDQVNQLVTAMFDARRDHPLVVVSLSSDTGQPRIAVDRISHALRDHPHRLAVLTSMDAAYALSGIAPNAFRCYGGAIRIIAAGASWTDHWRTHPLHTIYPDDDLGAELVRLTSDVADVARRPLPVRPEPPRPVLRGPVPLPGPHLFPASTATASTPASPASPASPTVTEATPTPAPAAAAADDDDTSTQASVATPIPAPSTLLPAGVGTLISKALADAEHRLVARITDTLIDLIGGTTSDDLARERSRADSAEQSLAETTRRFEALLATREADARAAIPTVYTNPEAQLRWEIEHAWLTGTPEPERKTLRAYTIKPGFLNDLTADLVPRAKVIDVMVDILTGDVWNNRICHQWLTRPGGDARINNDGGVGWRVNIKTESHGAPRLHWWEQPDNTALFDQVGHHDSAI